MKNLLWLDDLRNPLEDDWLRYSPIDKPFNVIWVKSYNEFVGYIELNDLPDAICFDHDLGLSESGYDCAKYLVDYCIDNGCKLPLYTVHSFNPVGKANIEGLLSSFNSFAWSY